MTVSVSHNRRRRPKSQPLKCGGSRAPYFRSAPALVLVAVVVLYPVANVGWSSFHQQNMLKPWDDGFVGLDNFSRILSDDLFWSSLAFTAKWVVTEVGLQLIFGVILALIVNETFRGRGLARALLFSPWAVAGILTTTI